MVSLVPALQGNLSTMQRQKLTSFQDDSTYLMSVLFRPSYLSTFSNMLPLLYVALFINLMVDTAGRISDPVGHTSLRWQDLRFFAFLNQDGSTTFFGILFTHNLKGGLDDPIM